MELCSIKTATMPPFFYPVRMKTIMKLMYSYTSTVSYDNNSHINFLENTSEGKKSALIVRL